MATERLKNISVTKEIWHQLKKLEAEMDLTHTQALEYLLERSKKYDELQGNDGKTSDLERKELD